MHIQHTHILFAQFIRDHRGNERERWDKCPEAIFAFTPRAMDMMAESCLKLLKNNNTTIQASQQRTTTLARAMEKAQHGSLCFLFFFSLSFFKSIWRKVVDIFLSFIIFTVSTIFLSLSC